MRQSKAKLIRRVLNLPRLPKAMNSEDRWFYRAVKGVYSGTAGPERNAYLDSAVAIRKAIQAKMEKALKARARAGRAAVVELVPVVAPKEEGQ